MVFTHPLQIHKQQYARRLRLGGEADAGTLAAMAACAAEVEKASAPRWAFARYALGQNLTLAGTGLSLPGKDIRRHLEGCEGCVLLGVTLGREVDRLVRAAAATDVAREVMLDAAASVLVEQYANEAEALARARVKPEYLTKRFSPGYGDLPLALQPELVRLLDGPKAIGLTVGGGGMLAPLKSITAILGVAGHPVTGHLAGCDGCANQNRCDEQEENSCHAE